MSSNWSKVIEYKCMNDCRREGCPCHKLQVQYFNTADIVNVIIDGGQRHCFDDNEFEAMLQAALEYNVMPFNLNVRMIARLERILERMKG